MIITGAVGVAVLIGLCVWQVQRLAWKQDIIEKLEARLALAGAEAEATLARSELTKLEAGARKEELDRLEAEVEAVVMERLRATLASEGVEATVVRVPA